MKNDTMYKQAVELIKETSGAFGASLLQRRLRVGYNRARSKKG